MGLRFPMRPPTDPHLTLPRLFVSAWSLRLLVISPIMAATTLSPDGEWQDFRWYGIDGDFQSLNGPFSFTIPDGMIGVLDITDTHEVGDRFTLTDFDTLLGTTPPPPTSIGEFTRDPNLAFTSPNWSSATYQLQPGEHEIQIETTPLPDGPRLGGGFLRVGLLGESPQLSWNTPSPITYGTPLSEAQLNASTASGIPGTYVYNPPMDTVLPAGLGQTLSVTFTPDDTETYDETSLSVPINVLAVALTITADNLTLPPGADIPQLTASFTGLVNGETAFDLDTLPTLTTTATSSSSPGTYPIVVEGGADNNYDITHVNGTLTIASDPDPNIAWPTMDPIVYGTPLSTAQLAATHVSGASGAFRYTPSIGTVLDAGTHTLSVSFVPDNSAEAQPGASWVTLEVLPAPLTIRPCNQVATYVGGGGGDGGGVIDVVEFVTVDDPNNPADFQNGNAIGQVSETFQLSKYEITNEVYTAFLNAVAKNDPTNNGIYDEHPPLYSPKMGTDARGGILQFGSAPNYSYATKPNMGNKPVNFVSFWDACRFCNWLHNGMPEGSRNASTTEDGVYDLTDPSTRFENAISRKEGARFYLPNESEWHKAAHYDPTKDGVGGYWAFPTQSDSPPTAALANGTGGIANPGANVANYDRAADWDSNGNGTIQTDPFLGQLGPEDGNVTSVGSAGEASYSYYGAADLGGNVAEWTESPINVWGRVARGGSWNGPWGFLEISFRFLLSYPEEFQDVGFRIARPLNFDESFIPTPTASFFGFVNGDGPNSLTSPLKLLSGASGTSPEGVYNIIAFNAASPNYDITFEQGVLLLNQKQNSTIHWPNPSNIVYGTPLSIGQLNATASFNGIPVEGTFTYEPPANTMLDPEEHELIVTFEPTDGETYNPITKKVGLTVEPAPLVIRADDHVRDEGTLNPTLTVSYEGFVSDESEADLWIPVAITTTANIASPPGTYPIVPQSAFSPNYAITFEPGTLTVLGEEKLPTEIEWMPAALVYGNALDSPQLNATEVNGVPGSFLYDPPLGTFLDAGANVPLSVVFQPDNSALYEDASTTVDVEVAKAPLTIQIDSASRPEMTENPTFTAAFQGFVLDDSVDDLDNALVLSTPAVIASPPGTYPITGTIGDDNNYAFVEIVEGTLTVTQVDRQTPDVNWVAPAAIAYGQALSETQLNATVADGVPGTWSYDPPAGTTFAVGSHTLSATFTPNDLSVFSVANVEVTIDVTQAPLAIQIDNLERPAGAENPTLTATYDGFVLGDTAGDLDAALELSTTADRESPPGDYPITGTIGADNNYAITVTDGTLTVSDKLIPEIIWGAPADLTYGTPLSETQLSASVADGVEGSFSYEPAPGTVLDAGTHELTATFAPTNEFAFDPATASVTITIVPADLTVRALDAEREANTENPVFEIAYEGFVNDEGPDDLSTPAEASTEADIDSAPGTYPIVPEGATSMNYAITFTNGTLTITDPASVELPAIRILRDGDNVQVRWEDTDDVVLYRSEDLMEWELQDTAGLVIEDGEAIITILPDQLSEETPLFFRLQGDE